MDVEQTDVMRPLRLNGLFRSLRSKWRQGIWIFLILLVWQTAHLFSSFFLTPAGDDDDSLKFFIRSTGNGQPMAAPSITNHSRPVWYNMSEESWEDSWKETLPNTHSNLWAFSAYYDPRPSTPHVVVFAILKTREPNIAHCQYIAADGSKFTVVAVKRVIRENWSLLYSAFRILCPLDKTVTKPVIQVAVFLPKSNQVPTAFLNIHDRSPDIPRTRRFCAMCVKPMHYEYDRGVWLTEFVEFYRLLGVDHFYFYNHTVGTHVQRVLQSYQVLGIVSVLSWTLPVKSQAEIRTEGMFAALNDCLYRTMYYYNYTVMVDFDEYIIPRKDLSFRELLPNLKAFKPTAGSFVFRNVFFYLYWENDTQFLDNMNPPLAPDDVPYLITLFKTRRLKQPHRHGVRSKFIVIPEYVFEVGNHNIWDYVTGKTSLTVPHDIALSHHYRICEFGGFECLRKPSATDRTTWRFANELVRNVAYICASVFPEEGKCPDAPPLGSL